MTYPKKLYKYVVPERIDVLKNQLIRFTQPAALNDLFELQLLFEEILSEEKLAEAVTPPFKLIEEALRNQYKNLTREQQDQMSVDQFVAVVRDNPQWTENFMRDIEPSIREMSSNMAPLVKKMISDAIRTKIGILSLSENAEHTLLWAHYASGHKGFAIEFNTEHKFFNRRRSTEDELFHLRKVRYADRTSFGRTLLDLDGDDVLVTKQKSWTYEDEWRMLVDLGSADRVLSVDNDEVYLFAIPLTAISAVILGARASVALHDELKVFIQSINSHSITLKRAVLDSASQKIRIDEI